MLEMKFLGSRMGLGVLGGGFGGGVRRGRWVRVEDGVWEWWRVELWLELRFRRSTLQIGDQCHEWAIDMAAAIISDLARPGQQWLK